MQKQIGNGSCSFWQLSEFISETELEEECQFKRYGLIWSQTRRHIHPVYDLNCFISVIYV